MKELGHEMISVFKFDIEGSEWSMFKNDILTWERPMVEQLAFELHTQAGSPHFLSPKLVGDKRSAGGA